MTFRFDFAAIWTFDWIRLFDGYFNHWQETGLIFKAKSHLVLLRTRRTVCTTVQSLRGRLHNGEINLCPFSLSLKRKNARAKKTLSQHSSFSFSPRIFLLYQVHAPFPCFVPLDFFAIPCIFSRLDRACERQIVYWAAWEASGGQFLPFCLRLRQHNTSTMHARLECWNTLI